MQNCLSLFPPQKRKSTPKQPCFLRLLVFLWVQVELSFKGPFRHFFWGGCMSSWLLITSSLHTRSPVKKTPSKLTALRNKGLIASLRETQRLSPDHKAGYFYLVVEPTHLKKIFVKKIGFIFPKFRGVKFRVFLGPMKFHHPPPLHRLGFPNWCSPQVRRLHWPFPAGTSWRVSRPVSFTYSPYRGLYTLGFHHN